MSNKKFIFPLDYDLVTERMIELGNLKNRNELASFLDIRPQSLANFKRKKIFPMNQIVNFAVKKNISVDKLLGLKMDQNLDLEGGRLFPEKEVEGLGRRDGDFYTAITPIEIEGEEKGEKISMVDEKPFVKVFDILPSI